LLLIWFPVGALARAPLFLLLVTIGLVTAWAHTAEWMVEHPTVAGTDMARHSPAAATRAMTIPSAHRQ
jgi:hypothetical protein